MHFVVFLLRMYAKGRHGAPGCNFTTKGHRGPLFAFSPLNVLLIFYISSLEHIPVFGASFLVSFRPDCAVHYGNYTDALTFVCWDVVISCTFTW